MISSHSIRKYMNYPDTFANYGYLSPEINEVKKTLYSDYAEEFTAAREAVREALHDLPISGGFSAPPGVIASICYWLRTIEACQGTIILAGSGMPTSAAAILRTAIENLFYFSSLIQNPELFEKIKSNENLERAKHSKGMMDDCSNFLSYEEKNILTTLINELPKGNKWTAYDAAKSAGLLDFYQSVYRGLSAVGAHASELSIDRMLSIKDNRLIVNMQPSEKDIRLILLTTISCLKTGTTTLSEHRDDKIKIISKSN